MPSMKPGPVRMMGCAVLVALIGTSCIPRVEFPTGVIAPLVSPDILPFVASQQLPDAQVTRVIASIPKRRGAIFETRYGAPNDCAAGCFYSSAIGVLYEGRIGWIRITDYDDIDPASRQFFDIEAGDTGLFDAATWEALDFQRFGLLWGLWLPWLAADADVPEETALRIAEGLYTYIAPHVGNLLLARAIAKGETGLLQRLACLPVFQGDAYADVRQAARDALGTAFEPCSAPVARR